MRFGPFWPGCAQFLHFTEAHTFEGDTCNLQCPMDLDCSSVIAMSSLCHSEMEKCDPLLTFATVRAYMALGCVLSVGADRTLGAPSGAE